MDIFIRCGIEDVVNDWFYENYLENRVVDVITVFKTFLVTGSTRALGEDEIWCVIVLIWVVRIAEADVDIPCVVRRIGNEIILSDVEIVRVVGFKEVFHVNSFVGNGGRENNSCCMSIKKDIDT
jgi:hypothetical protein